MFQKIYEIITESATSPQVGVPLTLGPGSLNLLGVALPDWLTIFSVIYVITLLLHKLWSWYKEIKQKDTNVED